MTWSLFMLGYSPLRIFPWLTQRKPFLLQLKLVVLESCIYKQLEPGPSVIYSNGWSELIDLDISGHLIETSLTGSPLEHQAQSNH